MTDRNRAWNAALEMAQKHQQFTVNDILDAAAGDESKRRTVRRVMEAMEPHEWIETVYDGKPLLEPCDPNLDP